MDTGVRQHTAYCRPEWDQFASLLMPLLLLHLDASNVPPRPWVGGFGDEGDRLPRSVGRRLSHRIATHGRCGAPGWRHAVQRHTQPASFQALFIVRLLACQGWGEGTHAIRHPVTSAALPGWRWRRAWQ